MIQQVNELDLAELRLEMRQIVTDKGYDAAMQALYEIIMAGKTLSEVILEEVKKNG